MDLTDLISVSWQLRQPCKAKWGWILT
jgi:hypothetical protein